MADISKVEELGKEQPRAVKVAQAKLQQGQTEQLNFFSFKRNQDYYTSTGRKVGDFFAGFCVAILLMLLSGMCVNKPVFLFSMLFIPGPAEVTVGFIVIIGSLIILFHHLGRKMLGLGLLWCMMLSLVLQSLPFAVLYWVGL